MLPEFHDASLGDFQPQSRAQERAREMVRGRPEGSYFLCEATGRIAAYLAHAQYRELALGGETPLMLRTEFDLSVELAGGSGGDSGLDSYLDSLAGYETLHVFLLGLGEHWSCWDVFGRYVEHLLGRGFGLTIAARATPDELRAWGRINARVARVLSKRLEFLGLDDSPPAAVASQARREVGGARRLAAVGKEPGVDGLPGVIPLRPEGVRNTQKCLPQVESHGALGAALQDGSL